MQKWLWLAAAAAAVVVGWWALSGIRVEMPWDQPQFDRVSRGDISVPITASGLIEPRLRFQIKSEASGEVIETPVRPGNYVRTGDVLVVLKKDEEQRAADRLKAELDRAEALLEQARINVRKSEANADQVRGTVARLEAEKRRLDFDLEQEKQRDADRMSSPQAMLIAQTAVDSVDAQLRSTRAQLRIAEESITEAAEAVKIQEAGVRAARKLHEDALDRLEKTTLVSRHDAIVTALFVRPSTLIQSGTNSFMGGTEVLELADISEKLVRVRIDEAEYGRVVAVSPLEALPETPGLHEALRAETDAMARTGIVRITVDAFRDEVFEGRIWRVEPQGRNNPGSSIIQFDIYVLITDPLAYKLPLGAQAQVEFTVDRAVGVLRVPNEAVKRLGEQSGVWIRSTATDGRQRHPRKFVPCRFGITDGEFTELRGVLDGEALAPETEVFTKLPKADDENES
ncbi:MAG: hypothetical protein HRU75_13200 [Planctomycetia bacterium]|nr:MAG: hypothetical protein HRU75_13200 [Planctomycetia bacterium]